MGNKPTGNLDRNEEIPNQAATAKWIFTSNMNLMTFEETGCALKAIQTIGVG